MSYIHEVDFRNLDFRLLELFSAIMRCRSVTDAARSLDIPQSTASRGLNRLREVLGDELFVRSVRGMEPTPCAHAIAPSIEEILRLGQSIEIVHRDFDPRDADRKFVVAGSDVGQYAVLAAFYRAIADFPRIILKTALVPGTDLAEALEAGPIDLAFGPYPSLAGGIMEQTLYQEFYMCFCRPDHPFARESTLDVFLESDHLLASGRNFAHAHTETETRLSRLLSPSRIRVMSESYLVAMAAVTDTDLILTMPANAIMPVAEKFGLAAIRPPLDLPRFYIKQYWHRRHHNDPGHRWLRATLRQALIKSNVAGMGVTETLQAS